MDSNSNPFDNHHLNSEPEGIRWRKAMICKMISRASFFAGHGIPALREELLDLAERWELEKALDSFGGALE